MRWLDLCSDEWRRTASGVRRVFIKAGDVWD